MGHVVSMGEPSGWAAWGLHLLQAGLGAGTPLPGMRHQGTETMEGALGLPEGICPAQRQEPSLTARASWSLLWSRVSTARSVCWNLTIHWASSALSPRIFFPVCSDSAWPQQDILCSIWKAVPQRTLSPEPSPGPRVRLAPLERHQPVVPSGLLWRHQGPRDRARPVWAPALPACPQADPGHTGPGPGEESKTLGALGAELKEVPKKPSAIQIDNILMQYI